jgi:alkyldihydroxyacetonephosphate synthase
MDGADATAAFSAFGLGGRPVLLVAFDEGAPAIDSERFELHRLAREFGARETGQAVGDHWWDHRFDGVAWYESVMGPERHLGSGVVMDLAEFAAVWRKIPRLYEEVRAALMRWSESVVCSLTNAYSTGASLMFTFLVRGSDDREVEERYLSAWNDAIESCLAAGGTITHNHGVGLLKVPYVERELGPPALRMLRRIKEALDPERVLNPGKLLPP